MILIIKLIANYIKLSDDMTTDAILKYEHNIATLTKNISFQQFIRIIFIQK